MDIKSDNDPSSQHEFFRFRKDKNSTPRHLTPAGPRTESPEALNLSLTEKLASLSDVTNPYQLLRDASDILDRNRRDRLDDKDLASIRKRERKIDALGSIHQGRDFDLAIEFKQGEEDRAEWARSRGGTLDFPARYIQVYKSGLVEALRDPLATPHPESHGYLIVKPDGTYSSSPSRNIEHQPDAAIDAFFDRFPDGGRHNAEPREVAKTLAEVFKEQFTPGPPPST